VLWALLPQYIGTRASCELGDLLSASSSSHLAVQNGSNPLHRKFLPARSQPTLAALATGTLLLSRHEPTTAQSEDWNPCSRTSPLCVAAVLGGFSGRQVVAAQHPQPASR
jgi:hypothetical protein